jgi:hypothetical protein
VEDIVEDIELVAAARGLLPIHHPRSASHDAKQRVKRCNPKLAYPFSFSSGGKALLSELLLVK